MLTDAQYRALKGLSNSALKLFAADPETYAAIHVFKTMPPRPTTPAMQFGLDLEEIVFDGRAFPEAVRMIPPGVLDGDGKRRGKPWNAWKRHMPLIRYLTPDEFKALGQRLMGCMAAITGHQAANGLLNRPQNRIHPAIQWEVDGLLRKAQLDLLTLDGLPIDLKQTEKGISPAAFAKQVVELRYHWQAETYLQALRACGLEPETFLFIVVKSSPAYSCAVYDLDEDFLSLARMEIQAALDRYADCLQTGLWKPVGYGQVQRLSAPKWAKYAAEWEAT
jgi:hypothetical protein